MMRLRVIKGPNARDQIAFCAFHLFLMEVKRMLATYMRRMRNSNLEIRIARSSCRAQLAFEKRKRLASFLTGTFLQRTAPPHPKRRT